MDIQIYAFEIEIDNYRFGGEISARDENHVLELVPTATCIEPLVDTYDVNEMRMLFTRPMGVIH